TTRTPTVASATSELAAKLGNHRRGSPALKRATAGQGRAFTVTGGTGKHRRCAAGPPPLGDGSVSIPTAADRRSARFRTTRTAPPARQPGLAPSPTPTNRRLAY